MDAFYRGTCLPGTREEILIEIMDWIRSDTKQNALWIRGVAGSGKSAIATTVAEYCRNASILGAFVFFSQASAADQRSSVFRTIAFQLAESNSTIARYVEAAVKRNKHITRAIAEVQFKELILEPLKATINEVQGPVVIIMESLDEYGPPDNRRSLMLLLKEAFGGLHPSFRFLITSRPELDIVEWFTDGTDFAYEFVLDHDSQSSKRDVLHYIDYEMRKVIGSTKIPIAYPWDEHMNKLADASEGLFIWASTAVKLVSLSPRKLSKLRKIVDNSHSLKGLDQLYKSILTDSGAIAIDDLESITRFSQVMGLILLSEVPLSGDLIDAILGFSKEETSREILLKLRSVLVFAEGESIRLLHASFADYLSSTPCPKPCVAHSDSSDCLSGPWFIDVSYQTSFIAKRCFEIMKNML
ncbi:uncharacterized protein FOMMEDRAFT_101836, partial [Fomitiporia mediterranea MF3/22]|uniref:uncharacterized protein n=1 Tax=Fomitiporia mediterranea (strain MF3/22) TaxID=694068 RepID=UPI0004407CC6